MIDTILWGALEGGVSRPLSHCRFLMHGQLLETRGGGVGGVFSLSTRSSEIHAVRCVVGSQPALKWAAIRHNN